MSSPSGTPVARSMISTRIGASHLALSRSLTRYLGAKLTLQRRCGLCSHSTHCGSRQPRLLPARVECFTLGAPPDIPGRGRVRGLQARRAARHTGARAGQASFTLGAPSDIPGRTRGPGVIDARRAARHTGARPGRAAFTLGAPPDTASAHMLARGPDPNIGVLIPTSKGLRERTFCASGRPPLQRVGVSQVNQAETGDGPNRCCYGSAALSGARGAAQWHLAQLQGSGEAPAQVSCGGLPARPHAPSRLCGRPASHAARLSRPRTARRARRKLRLRGTAQGRPQPRQSSATRAGAAPESHAPRRSPPAPQVQPWAQLGAHRQSCRKTSCRSRCSTARRPYSGAGRLAMHSVATCCTTCGLSCGLIRPANAPANWASRARTYSCGCCARQSPS